MGNPEFVEIRVHGAGDYDYYGSLGKPEVRQINLWVESATPPSVPRHRLRIVNWSRSNRRNTGSLWYAAFPFTLVNVAGRMAEPAPDQAQGFLIRLCIRLAGFLLTMTQVAWLVVLGETLLRYAPARVQDVLAGWPVPVFMSLMLAGWLAYRVLIVRRRQTEPLPPRYGLLYGLHGLIILATGGLLAWLRPAQWEYGGWPSVNTPLDDDRLDAMALWIIVSSLTVLLLSAVPLLSYWLASRGARSRLAPAVSAGCLLVVAVLLLHTGTALIRMALENVLDYVSGIFGAAEPGYDSTQRVLLAWDDPAEAGDSRLDLFPFMALIVLVAAVLAAAVVLAFTPGHDLSRLFQGKAARGRWWQGVIISAPVLLPRVLPLAALFGVAGTLAAVLLGEGRLGGPWLALAVLLLQIAAGTVILIFLLGQLKPVRDVLGKVGDVAGFWPIRDHPLAGASYRDAVVSGICTEANRLDARELALVAHSQGSVVCAWLFNSEAEYPLLSRPHLVTAGSPLLSLYAAFFPQYFPAQFFAAVSGATRSWVNFWRETDSIGTAIPGADNRLIPDPDAGGTVHRHGDYWTAPQLVDHVRSLSDGATGGFRS